MDSTRYDEMSAFGAQEISIIEKIKPNITKVQSPKPSSKKKEKSPPITIKRTARKAALKVQELIRKNDLLTDEETASDTENSDWRDNASVTDSDSEWDNASKSSGRSRQRKIKKTPSTTPKTTRRKLASTDKNNKKKDDKLVYLDLSANEVVEVDENYGNNVSGLLDFPSIKHFFKYCFCTIRFIAEEDLAEVTRRFLEDDLRQDNKENNIDGQGDFKKPKPSRRKLFTHQYNLLDDDSINQTSALQTPKTKTRDANAIDSTSKVKIDIPQFMFKPRKLLERGSEAGTPTSKELPKVASEANTPVAKELPKPMRDVVSKSLNTKSKGNQLLISGKFLLCPSLCNRYANVCRVVMCADLTQ